MIDFFKVSKNHPYLFNESFKPKICFFFFNNNSPLTCLHRLLSLICGLEGMQSLDQTYATIIFNTQ